jgi:hypothetical protein
VQEIGAQEGTVVDYTKIPTELEQKFDALDESNALRPTIINPGTTWSKSFQKSLLSEPENTTLDTEVRTFIIYVFIFCLLI